MYLSGGPQFAPSGGAIMLTSGFCSLGTNIVKAIHLPSGDQLSAPGESASFVSRASCPESIHRTTSSDFPSTAETNTMRPPSGDQRAELAERSGDSSARVSLPSELA